MGQPMQAREEFPPVVGKYVPARHATHVDGPVAPGKVEYLPIAQGVHKFHAVSRGSDEYVPARQS